MAKGPFVRITMTAAESDAWRPEIKGWSTDILPWYDWAARDLLPDGARIAEVGVYQGRSALFLAERLASVGKTKCCVECVDLFDGGNRAAFGINRERLPKVARSMVFLYPGLSLSAAAGAANGQYDLVFIDAGHTYEDVRADIEAWLSKVRTPGGIIAGHDFDLNETDPNRAGVCRAVLEKFGASKIRTAETVWWVEL